MIGFGDEDLKGTIQLHEEALVVALHMGGFDVKRVMIDQRSCVEIMYPNLYQGLGLKDKDLTKYDTLLVGFDEKIMIPVGQIKLPVVAEGKQV